MRRVGVIGAVCVLLLFLVPVQAGSSSAQSVAGPFRPGIVLVGMRPGASLATTARLLADHGLQVESDLTPLSIMSVRVPNGQEMATAESLRRTGQIAFAELDYRAHATGVVTPTDPGWTNQWGPAKIEAPAAWSIVTNTTGIVIAVVDSGIKLDHTDLVTNLWTNADEIPLNVKDDDGNGKIDDVNGWHFFQRWTGSTYVPDEDANVQDDYGHGTHVAGIAAAAANNGIGIAGIAWNAHIMPIKVLDQYGNGWYSDIAAGISYAADNGACIINLSLGGTADSQTLRAAVDYARQRGALVIAATGNTHSAVLYPAAYEPVLAVAATDSNDRVADFSNHGAQVDVAAPGVDIYSTWPWVSGYFTKSGTSMAAPYVSGAAALIWSYAPSLSADAVAGYLTRTAVDIGEPGWDEYSGWGRLDVYRAMPAAAMPRWFLPLISRTD